jgi:hypothetical protein
MIHFDAGQQLAPIDVAKFIGVTVWLGICFVNVGGPN